MWALPASLQVSLRNRWIDRKKAKWIAAGRPLPPPHEVKQVLIRDAQRRTGYRTLIETGTHRGAMVEAQKHHFKKVYSIELSEHFHEKATARFKADTHVSIVLGDSGVMLDKVLNEVSEPAVLWLDGHYSSGDTAKGNLECPIYGELEAVLKRKTLSHLILIDDARCFLGGNDYPTVEELTAFIAARDPRYAVRVEDDVIVVERGA